jgi:hypothetical protein
MKKDHDQHAGSDLPPLHVGQKVRVQNENKSWDPATITKVCDEPRSYVVSTPNGSSLRRNRSHIREMPSNNTKKHITFADEQPGKQPEPPKQEEVMEGTTDHRLAGGKEDSTAKKAAQNTTRSGRVCKPPVRYGRWV